ncbi:PE-PPE domain-containing protein [Mycolicibacterium rufum]|uniref:PE-PPE domain-containing protein n=1 Tax=Mycolicibacterium rufum TaxID=318424 RepID=A0A9X2YE71_9MYCO|nr:PE-PPE domain-containing protein [Mycolicibacterium rufum]MCV7071031.1 PE-PPE domain-containing protein [Mycolicibacterium rufum]ULP37698.1 PE-PPE domain-containing protein [Mycolicibacterium rufum]
MPSVASADTSDSTTSQSSASDAAGTPRPSVAHPRSLRRTSVDSPESIDAPTTQRRHSTTPRATATKLANRDHSDTDDPTPRRADKATRGVDPGADVAGSTTVRAAPETSPTPAEDAVAATTTVAVEVPTAVTANASTRPKPATPAQATLLSTLLAWTRRASARTAEPTTGGTNTSDLMATQAAAAAPLTVAAGSSSGIDLPASATVFTLRGMNVRKSSYNPMLKEYGGMFAKAPYTMVEVKYSAAWNRTSITEGVQLLDAALLSTPGDIIVMAHSEGAQVASRWMRTYADDPTRAALAGRVTFLLSGNPLRSSQGGGGQMIGLWENDGTRALPTPTTTPWAIVDVARRWDGWADWPDDTSNRIAVRNAKKGMTSFHFNYNNVDIYDPANTVWHEGNTTYVLTHENTPPIMRSLFANPTLASLLRGRVETGYQRPPNDIATPSRSAVTV